MQTAGLGTHGKKWLSPAGGNIYATFILPIDPQLKHMHNIAQIMSLSIATVLHEIDLQVELKWPNDVMFQGKKLGGVLAEMHGEVILIGVGVNVNMNEESCGAIDQPATSIYLALGDEQDAKELLCCIGDQFMVDYQMYEEEGFVPFYEKYVALMDYIGASISYREDAALGTIKAVAPDGRLIVEGPNGEETIASGSILSKKN